MNIFALDESQDQCAKWYVDSHVIKMQLESVQLLSTTVRYLIGTNKEFENSDGTVATYNVLNGETFKYVDKIVNGVTKGKHWVRDYYIAYETTHVNHPSTKWVRESFMNYKWLETLTLCLHDEWRYRYNHSKIHAAVRFYLENTPSIVPHTFPIQNELTPFSVAMDPQYIVDDPIESYKRYYALGKKHLHRWTRREKPIWIET